MNKKDEEYKYIKSFLNLYDVELMDLLKNDKNQECPDFIVESIGIESSLYLMDKRIEYSAGINKLEKSIDEKLMINGIFGVSVNIVPRDIINTRRIGINEISDEIVCYVMSNWKGKEIGHNDIVINKKRYSYLSIEQSLLENKNRICFTYADYFMKFDKVKLIEQITIKDTKLMKYRKGLQEMWLVIIINSFSQSGFYQYSIEEFEDVLVKTKFNKVFVYWYAEKKYLEIPKID